MFEELGIDNMLILGSGLNESHLWNLVKISDEWYHLDITWNDPLPDVKGRVIYKYFLKDDNFMRNTHTWNAADYPKAKNSSYTHLTEFKSNKLTPIHKITYAPDDTYSNWAKIEIEKAITYELVTQKILSNFTADITREEFAELSLQLYRILGGKIEIKANSNIFKDTQNLAILQAYSVGIVNGIGDGKFDPKGKITRQQMACMLERVLTSLEIYPVVTKEYRYFSDEDEIADDAKSSVQLMNKLGVISGVGKNIINPRGNTSREQAIAMLVRLLEHNQVSF
ncbi:S-layer family protein [Serpentinicella alkaliphila]|uniref:S-layer family protein n=2 Tax=Serpentinicella alkaliphila TaxID=1734049 RepID=A0A4R2TLV0_9FIRM|nr:S-layer family protein [Serpentinicella alkaliphila]